ncbi:pepsin-like aspartic protease [Aspergillus thermomutatus]|uniref:Peptidase A1 domain-containing protein n=1 Tax=Aspergillus thermomutatus TaxID=41047 RepID=A0A397GFD7_ASPTH|nr:uncharacterized protein CDV56_101438 [Aspergillus thermomutatus]RHZ49177.1 hypothetical protein CDV56_101438 [Aspergillus thermomutatus]
MKGFSLALALTAGSTVSALSLHRRDVPAVVEFPIEHRRNAESLQKRDHTVEVSLHNTVMGYYMLNLTLGDPGQAFSLALDTGSSDTWVNTAKSELCSANDHPCNAYGVYNASGSSGYKTVGTRMNATYAGGSSIEGPYVTDKLTIGNAKVDDFQFAVAENTTMAMGIAGVGYRINEYQASHDSKIYANLPQALVDSGAIKSSAYSLWLNDLNANTGSILFGGVNKAKYTGDLQTLPIVPVKGRYTSLALALTGVTVEGKDTNSYTDTLPLAVSLDTGSIFTMLPEDLVDKIYNDLGAKYMEKERVAYIDCEMMNKDYNVTYTFSGVSITVGMNELVLNYVYPDFPDGTCLFGLVPSAEGVNLMGDTFLRSAYVVYDLANNEISLAATNFHPGNDDIHEIGTGDDSVPGATRVKSAVSSATGNGVESATASAVVVTVTGHTAGATTTGATEPAATGTDAGKTAAGGATSTSSKGAGALPTSHSGYLLAGLAGLLLV